MTFTRTRSRTGVPTPRPCGAGVRPSVITFPRAGSDRIARQDWTAGVRRMIFWSARSRRRTAERKAMIHRTHELPVTQQCKSLGLARSTIYYTRQEVSAEDLTLMRRID